MGAVFAVVIYVLIKAVAALYIIYIRLFAATPPDSLTFAIPRAGSELMEAGGLKI